MNTNVIKRSAGGFAGVLLALGIAGCGDSLHVVEGTAAIKGAKLNHGTLSFHGDKGETRTASVNPDGSFMIVNPPAGAVKVTVEADPMRVAAAKKAAAPPKDVVPITKGSDAGAPSVIDRRYRDVANAVAINVNPTGHQTVNIDFP